MTIFCQAKQSIKKVHLVNGGIRFKIDTFQNHSKWTEWIWDLALYDNKLTL